MGYALITGGGANGRYSIRLDFGEAQKAQLLAAYGSTVSTLDVKIAQTQVNLDAAETAEGETLAYIDGIVTAAIADGSAFNTAFTALYTDLVKNYKAQLISNEPIRIALRKLKDARAAALRRIASYNNVNAGETRSAWCADFTEDAEGYVATMEIPGESDLILIKPGAPYPDTFTTGVLSAREFMSPSQAYFNAAILPGWQKELPTHRWGTITSIDDAAGTVNISLFDSKSSAQRLPVNQTPTLTGVPVRYMECGHTVFETGDRVVVEFRGQDWSRPRVIGFVDNPRPCSWPIYGVDTRGFYGPPIQFATPYREQFDAVWLGSIVVEARVDRGAWKQLTIDDFFTQPPYQRLYSVYEIYSFDHFVSMFVLLQDEIQTSGSWDIDRPPADVVGAIGVVADSSGLDATPHDVEFRITSGGSIVFNCATAAILADNQFDFRAKGRAGILNIWGYQVSELDYELGLP